MSGGGGARVSITGGLKKTIQDIREIAGEHSDEDIYAMLKECSMDPNETAHRLLHLDTFHEVKKKHGKRKENVVIKASDSPGKQFGTRVGRGAKAGSGNFHSQNTSQVNTRRSFGGSKENGYPNRSKGHKSENKNGSEGSRSGHVKINGKGIKEEAPQPNAVTIGYAGEKCLCEIVKSDETHVPSDGGQPWAAKLTPATISTKQEKSKTVENHKDSAAPVVQLLPFPSVSSELCIDVIAPGNTVHENQYAMSNGNANWSDVKMPNVVPHSEIGDTAKSQTTVINSNDQPCDAEEKQPISEETTSVSNDEASKLAVSDVSDGHVVFPEHLQVPEAYKKKLTFGSFGSTWPLDVIHTSDGCAASTDMPMPADDSDLVKTVDKPSIESSGNISSSARAAQEKENPSYPQSPQHVLNSTPLLEHASSDVVVEIVKQETENLRNGGSEFAYHPSNHFFGYAPKPPLQAHDSAEPQVGNFIASSTSDVDRNSNIQPPGVTHDSVTSPPPGAFLRQTYQPNFLPYGHYYPQFFVPQVQQYVTHGGFPQQPLMPNVYLTTPAAGGIKYPHQPQKQGTNPGTDGYIGVPSGYHPYVPYTFPYGLPPAAMPSNVAADEDHAAQLKENSVLTTEQQTEGSGEWMAGTGRTVPGLQMNPFYNVAPGQGHPMVFPPTPTGFGTFGGVYHHPLVQTIPAPQPTMHPHNQQPHSMPPAEAPPPPTGFYQQPHPQPQGAHFLRNNNKQ